MAESVDLNVICKNCGSEVSPYITECPYCGQRLRKRAPKLSRQDDGGEVELAPVTKKRFRRSRRRRERTRTEQRPLSWLVAQRPYATVALVLAGAVIYVVNQAGPLGYHDLGAVVGPLQGDWWRLITAQFNYDNVGYLFAVGVAAAIFGTSLERRYSGFATAGIFLACGALGMYLATEIEAFPIAIGGNGAALGLIAAWTVRDLRDRRSGYDTESDLLGVAAIAAVLILMPVLDRWADAWVGLGGATLGCLIGLSLPERR